MDDSGYSGSTTLAGELAAKLSRQIDLIAASASASTSSAVVSGTSSGDDDDDDRDEDDDEEDYEAVNAAEEDTLEKQADGSVPPSSNSSVTSEDVAATASLESNPSMLSLQASLARLRSTPMPSSYSKLKESIEHAWRSEMELQHAQTIVSAASTSSSPSTVPESVADNLVWTVNAHLTASTYCAVLESLLSTAEKVKQEELYWQSIESRDRHSIMYLVQTMPVRVARSLRVLLDRLQYLASSPRPPTRLISYTAIKRALPPSLLLTSLFPHLSASRSSSSISSFSIPSPSTMIKHSATRNRSLLFLTLSPLMLTRQEVSLRRKELKKLRNELANKIGCLVRDAENGLEDLTSLSTTYQPRKMKKLGAIMGQRISHLEDVISDTAESSDDEAVKQASSTAYEPRAPNELLLSLQQTVHKPISTHDESLSARLNALSRPSKLTRAWPWLITVPLGSYILVTQLYNSRMTIYNYYTYAKETAIGFLMDWVIEPTRKIFETLRHGEDGENGLNIMSKESLKSDFDSLERMVVQFAKDQAGNRNITQEELTAIGRNVRQGDLSVVLGAYEQDLKSPLKSAISGTLVRTLLIQVQKVKVDVDLAMDGIEKMLKSQQLTFAFVGVAPSMVLLYFITTYAKSALSVGESSSSKSARRKVWYTLRNIDRLLTNSLDSTSPTLSNETTGLLLIELTTLRKYVGSPAFPTRDRSVRAAFLEDVRDLENDRGIQSRLRALDRLMRVWEKYIRV